MQADSHLIFQKGILVCVIIFIALIGIFCLYSLFHIGDSQSSEISITQTIDWHDFDYQSEEDMAADADLVLTGTVVSTEAYSTDTGEGSLVELSVDSVQQGDAVDSVTVFQYGNDEVAPPDEFPLMQPGERYKLYLYADETGSFYRVVGGYQGASKLA